MKFQFAKLSLKPMIMIMIYMINTLELVLGSFSTEVFKKIVYNIKSSEIFFNLGTDKNIKYLRSCL